MVDWWQFYMLQPNTYGFQSSPFRLQNIGNTKSQDSNINIGHSIISFSIHRFLIVMPQLLGTLLVLYFIISSGCTLSTDSLCSFLSSPCPRSPNFHLDLDTSQVLCSWGSSYHMHVDDIIIFHPSLVFFKLNSIWHSYKAGFSHSNWSQRQLPLEESLALCYSHLKYLLVTDLPCTYFCTYNPFMRATYSQTLRSVSSSSMKEIPTHITLID